MKLTIAFVLDQFRNMGASPGELDDEAFRLVHDSEYRDSWTNPDWIAPGQPIETLFEFVGPVCLNAIDGFCNEVQKPWTSEISDKGSCDKWRGSY